MKCFDEVSKQSSKETLKIPNRIRDANIHNHMLMINENNKINLLKFKKHWNIIYT